jgi:hypothetical protein
MPLLKIIFLILLSSFKAYSYEYKVIKENNHVIHVVTINPELYDINLTKADNQIFGRKKLQDLAKNSTIAINGGFFSTDIIKQGRPTGTLVIKGEIFTLNFGTHSCLIIDQDNKLIIKDINITPNIKINNNNLIINSVNSYNKKNVILYTKAWGRPTPNSFDRNEILINDSKISAIYDHTDNYIGQNQYILSVSKDIDISNIYLNDKVNLELDILFQNNISVVRGIPMLIKDGKITSFVFVFLKRRSN